MVFPVVEVPQVFQEKRVNEVAWDPLVQKDLLADRETKDLRVLWDPQDHKENQLRREILVHLDPLVKLVLMV